MAGIAALGFRFALDRLDDLNLDPRALHERGVRIVRATVPGSYVVPAAVVEDMYAPDVRARTGMGQMTIAAQ
jgi:hypothetical protein